MTAFEITSDSPGVHDGLWKGNMQPVALPIVLYIQPCGLGENVTYIQQFIPRFKASFSFRKSSHLGEGHSHYQPNLLSSFCQNASLFRFNCSRSFRHHYTRNATTAPTQLHSLLLRGRGNSLLPYTFGLQHLPSKYHPATRVPLAPWLSVNYRSPSFTTGIQTWDKHALD
jgi:hypothetical protein